ncbi:hypothetical protein CYMTET_44717 [Cymbomonas tetramitiformis]|uniref:Uncharacterized protein n=1 Tax=Cymbomonas tetramitiformis TaxID=36881 RepID=A0AAE0BZN1_9CHLO|nr:hypothetical protein CYMTET_44717 [Cymbomonas tetramitiformis]
MEGENHTSFPAPLESSGRQSVSHKTSRLAFPPPSTRSWAHHDGKGRMIGGIGDSKLPPGYKMQPLRGKGKITRLGETFPLKEELLIEMESLLGPSRYELLRDTLDIKPGEHVAKTAARERKKMYNEGFQKLPRVFRAQQEDVESKPIMRKRVLRDRELRDCAPSAGKLPYMTSPEPQAQRIPGRSFDQDLKRTLRNPPNVESLDGWFNKYGKPTSTAALQYSAMPGFLSNSLKHGQHHSGLPQRSIDVVTSVSNVTL